MQNILLISQVVISVLLSLLVLMQNKEGGLSAMMGGGDHSFQSTKRGAEKVIYNATVLFGILFLANALAFVLI
ncbi:MAG: preprotein translocase subunit SecG [Candidatus Peregrinibacteria bacterium]